MSSLPPHAETAISSGTSKALHMSPPCCGEDFGVAARLVAGVAALAGHARRGLAHARDRRVVRRGRARDRGDAPLLVARLEEKGGLAVREQGAHGAGARGDERLAERRRLDQHVREAVVVRWNHDEVAGEVVRDEIEAVDGRDDRGAVEVLQIGLADEQKAEVVASAAQRVEEKGNTLLRFAWPEKAEKTAMIAQRCGACAIGIRRLPEIEINPV